MQRQCRVLAAAVCGFELFRSAHGQNPLEKTIELLTSLQGQIVTDGERQQQAYDAYAGWCKTTSDEKAKEVSDFGKSKGKIEADLQVAISDIDDATTKVEELGTEVSANEQKKTDIITARGEEKNAFTASEKQLMESIDVLGNAITILEKEIQGSSLLQTSVDTSDLEAALVGLGAVVDALGVPTQGSRKLASLLQARQAARSAAREGNSPKAEAFVYQSQSIVEVMEDMRDKAEEQLRQLRQGEANAEINFGQLKASIEGTIKNLNENLKEEKNDKASAIQAKATAEGDLTLITDELKKSEEALKHTRDSCIRIAADHEASAKSRKQELEVLAKAKKTIQASMAPASFVQLASTSQVRRQHSHVSKICKQVVTVIKQLATQHKSVSLGQLASRLTTVVRFAVSSSKDPFAKVKELVQDMIQKLEREQTAEGHEKEYCDSETKKTAEQKADLKGKIDSLRARTGQAEAKSADLKREVKNLQQELAEIEKQETEADRVREIAHKAFLASKADLQKSLDGVRAVIRLLRDYYANDDEEGEALLQTEDGFTAAMQQPEAPQNFKKSTGAGAGIIGILETSESDLAKSLAEEETEDASEQAEHEKLRLESEVLKTQRAKDAEYKTAEHKSLDKAIAEFSSDFETESEELEAVEEYQAKVHQRCSGEKSFEDRKAKREAEIQGLQEALAILTNDAEAGTLLQRGSSGGGKRAQRAITVHF